MHALVICEPWQVSERFRIMGYIVSSLSLEACCWETSEGWRGLSCALTQGWSSGVSGNLELWMVHLNPVLTSQTHKAQPCHNCTVWIKSVLLRGQGTVLYKYQSLSSDFVFLPVSQELTHPLPQRTLIQCWWRRKCNYHLLSHPCHILTPGCGLARLPIKHESTLSTDVEKVYNKTSNHTRLSWMGG